MTPVDPEYLLNETGSVITWNEFVGPDPAAVDIMLDQLEVDYLNEIQEKIIHDRRRFIQVVGGERAGKSWISGLYLATRMPYGDVYWIIGPDYELARPEFTYALDHLQKMGAIENINRDVHTPKMGSWELRTKTGQVLMTKTAMEVEKVAAVAPSGIIMAEAAQQSYAVYLRATARVAEKRGWLLLSGTLEGSESWYVDKYEDWLNPDNAEGGVTYCMPSWSNRLVYPGGREDPEILRMETAFKRVEGLFEERLAAVPISPTDLIFREYRYSVHVSDKAKFNPDKPVYLAIDPSSGTKPYAVIACQFHAYPYPEDEPQADPIDFCDAIDEIYNTGMICEQIIEEAKERPWWGNVVGGAIDVEAPDERKRWRSYGKVNLVADKIEQHAGIRRLKSFLYFRRDERTGRVLEVPHLRISPNVKSLPYEFRKFKKGLVSKTKKVIDISEVTSFKENPPRDQANHSIKALWYLLIARYGDVKAGKIAKPVYSWRPKYAGKTSYRHVSSDNATKRAG